MTRPGIRTGPQRTGSFAPERSTSGGARCEGPHGDGGSTPIVDAGVTNRVGPYAIEGHGKIRPTPDVRTPEDDARAHTLTAVMNDIERMCQETVQLHPDGAAQFATLRAR